MKNKLTTCAAIVFFILCALPMTGQATTWGNAQVSWQADSTSCWTSSYGVLTNEYCDATETLYMWPTTQAHGGYYNVQVQVYNSNFTDFVGCYVVGTTNSGGTYFNSEMTTTTTGDTTLSGSNYIGSTALYIECKVPYTCSVLGWGID